MRPSLSRFLPLLIVVAGCGGKQVEPLSGEFVVRDEALQLPSRTVANSTPAALANAYQTACDGRCERIWIDVDPRESLATAQKAALASKGDPNPPQISLLPPSATPIDVGASDDPCEVEISVQDDGAYVRRAGTFADYDLDCDNWSAQVCRNDDGEFDWPRLRSLVGEVNDACLSIEVSPQVTLAAGLHDAIGRPTLRFVAPFRPEASLPEDALRAKLRAKKSDFAWCYESESGEELRPISVKLRVLVGADGVVQRVAIVDASRSSPQFEACVTRAVDGLRLDPPQGGAAAIAEYPLEFAPNKNGPTNL